MWNQRPCFRFEIDNFSEKEAAIASHAFVSGGCEWYIFVNPKGIIVCDDQLPLCLAVPNPKSLGLGWERRADYYWVLLNQSDKVLYKTPIARGVGFCAETTSYAIRNTLPLSIFQEKGFLDNDKLIIDVYIKVTEAFDGEGGEVASQVNPVRNILRNACSKLSELAEVGFKLDWWKSKLDEVSSEWKKVDDSDESRVQELEERTKKLQLMASKLEEDSLEKKKPDDTEGSRVQQLEERVKNLDFKLDCFESKLEESSLERKPSSDTDGSRVQQLEERFNDIVKMVGGFRLDFMSNNFTSKLEGVKMKTLSDAVWSRVHQLDERLKNLERMAFKLEKKTSDEGVGSRVQQLEETLKNLELMELGSNLSCVKSKLEEVSLERKKSDDANGSLAKTFQERLENLELRVLDLIEMNKKKAKSCDDDFLLVDEVA